MTSKTGTRTTTKSRAKSGTTSRSRTTRTTKTTKTASAPTKPRAVRKTPAAPKVKPTLVEAKNPVVTQPELRKKELIDLVVARSGVKKKDAKPAIEAMLAVLGEALAEGRELNLRPMGKLKVNRVEKKSNGTIIASRIRQPRDTLATSPQPDPIAHAAE